MSSSYFRTMGAGNTQEILGKELTFEDAYSSLLSGFLAYEADRNAAGIVVSGQTLGNSTNVLNYGAMCATPPDKGIKSTALRRHTNRTDRSYRRCYRCGERGHYQA